MEYYDISSEAGSPCSLESEVYVLQGPGWMAPGEMAHRVREICYHDHVVTVATNAFQHFLCGASARKGQRTAPLMVRCVANLTASAIYLRKHQRSRHGGTECEFVRDCRMPHPSILQDAAAAHSHAWGRMRSSIRVWMISHCG